jgi:hypothetical protein
MSLVATLGVFLVQRNRSPIHSPCGDGDGDGGWEARDGGIAVTPAVPEIGGRRGAARNGPERGAQDPPVVT